MDQMVETEGRCRKTAVVEVIMDLVRSQKHSLQKDVNKYCEERKVQKTDV